MKILFLLMLTALTPARAADQSEHPIEIELQRCIDSGKSNHGMRMCIDTATAAWDKELNRVWGELMATLGPEQKELARAAQRKWVAFRDAEIAALDSSYGAMEGTMFQLMHADSIGALTSDRVSQLQSVLDAKKASL